MAQFQSAEDISHFNTEYIKTELQHLKQIFHNNIPQELKEDTWPHWIMWEATPSKKALESKVPFDEDNPPKILKKPMGSGWQDLANQRSYETILPTQKKFQEEQDRPVSLGFVFSDAHPYICIDIDDASPANHTLLKSFKSYIEWSPSGKGAHIWIQTLTLAEKAKVQEALGKGVRNKTAERDLFISSGYVTITGKPITIFSEDTITIYSAEDILTKLSPYFLHDITSINTPLAKKEGEALKKAHDTKHQKKPEQRLTGNQIFRYLELIPCKNLTSDIFSRLNTPGKSARLDMSNEEEARQPWLMIGQALHSYFEGSYEGCLVWDQWSQQGNKYDEEALYSTWKSFKEVEDGITIATIVALANAQKLEFIDTTSKGLPLGTPRNFTSYMAFFDYKIRLNLINNQLDISPPRHKLNEWGLNNLDTITSLNEAAALIHGDMQLQGIPPTAFTMPKLRHYLKLHASLPENQYHPIKDYFKDMKNTWDGKSRLDDLMSTIIPPDDVNLDCIDANRLFLRKWLIQVVAAAHASQKNSFMLNLVLILIGEQGIGKTKWVKSLFPPRLREFCAGDKEVQVSTFRSDAVKLTMELTSTLICNINEIDRSFHPSTFADFKAFLDKTSEQVVLPYGDAPVVKSRQTVFIGSTNKRHFLQDVSGNRRFYLLHTKNLIDNHTIDIDQLWAEVTTYYSNGEKWWIEKNTTNPKEIKALAIQTQVNNVGMFIKNEAIYEKLDDIFNAKAPISDWEKLDFVTIRSYLGLNDLVLNSKKFNETKYSIETWLKATPNYTIPWTGTGARAKRFYLMPPIRNAIAKLNKEDEIAALQARIKAIQDSSD